MIAPASRQKPIRAPVFNCWSRVTAARSSASSAAARSIIWPPAIPAGPAARASSRDQLGPDEGILVGRLVGEDLEGQSVERVAGEDRGRLVDRPCAGSACRGEDRHRPSPADRRGSANRRGCTRPRRRPGRRARGRRVEQGGRRRRRARAAASCRRRSPHSASLRRARPGDREEPSSRADRKSSTSTPDLPEGGREERGIRHRRKAQPASKGMVPAGWPSRPSWIFSIFACAA